LLLFLSAVVLFYLYGLRFDSQKADPYDNGTNLAYFAAGIVVFIIAVVLAIIIDGIYFPLLYKNSREIYMSSDEYKQQVEKYSEIDLIKFTNRELKWLKKLGWINKIEYQHTINRKHKK
jgi:ABC-type bacteriocin/lantibiotic exporter with double-glycine peptidase domain